MVGPSFVNVEVIDSFNIRRNKGRSRLPVSQAMSYIRKRRLRFSGKLR
jgi:hypothetical protein